MVIVFPSSGYKVTGSISATLPWVKLCRESDDKSRGKRNNSNIPYEYNRGGFTTDIIALAYS
ncbi:hypothetical protein CQJ27_17360 [Escherichia sp. E1130]|nr:hypothetical protein CQB02_20200 [Escherichia coli]TGB78124.1 hypothetical protein CRI66_09340 [Escherichia sp. E4694]TGB89490.1 hypothetical protein CRI64_23810 [Escherichia sp. E2748]TGB89956.1 hypothetical protein CRG94_22070 [Escherichia sp. E3356]TGB99088.1 hypothetical protein CRG92_17785 [Escherichia sp. E2586]TGC11772.1 hypothetical protein CRG93_01785 [Escherichia sp. E2593]TGC12464.1 hypothetical protein CRU79_23560 [Escherichia sp. E4385]TGC13318.1 hypothetical protein CQJ28_22